MIWNRPKGPHRTELRFVSGDSFIRGREGGSRPETEHCCDHTRLAHDHCIRFNRSKSARTASILAVAWSTLDSRIGPFQKQTTALAKQWVTIELTSGFRSSLGSECKWSTAELPLYPSGWLRLEVICHEGQFRCKFVDSNSQKVWVMCMGYSK